jgi:hypothetical protein
MYSLARKTESLVVHADACYSRNISTSGVGSLTENWLDGVEITRYDHDYINVYWLKQVAIAL